MKLSVFGLGYVGIVSAACFAKEGHEVVGVDISPSKVDLINQGKSPIIETDIDELISEATDKGLLSAPMDTEWAIRNSDISLVCVGTPSQDNGSLGLKYVVQVCEQIGEFLAEIDFFHIVVIRSTMLPGTMHDVVIPTLEQASGKKCGVDFGLCNNPEFLRESTAVYDFYNPPKTVIGESDERSGNIVASLYANLDAPLNRVDVQVAEMVKYADNVWHAVKVVFGNEVGSICKSMGIDSHEVMDIFVQDTKLNLSPYYLRPGFAFGGSCLPKDVRALTYKAKALDIDVPLMNSLILSNKYQIDRAIQLIRNKGSKLVGVLGLSFKAGTDDIRESPILEVIETLLGKGYELSIYDTNVNPDKLVGSNREYLLKHLPHIAHLMVNSVEDLLDKSETVVVANGDGHFRQANGLFTKDHQIVDLVRIFGSEDVDAGYDGICW